jgi:hypothetical protein
VNVDIFNWWGLFLIGAAPNNYFATMSLEIIIFLKVGI